MELHPVMNNTKWDELRLAMYGLGSLTYFRAKDMNGYYSPPDAEWFHHFRTGGYETMVYVDIIAKDATHREAIRAALKRVHVPGDETELGFRVFGYTERGQAVDYI
ncbi:DUF6678 family protein [Shinella sp.]|uniref:DUF6678 family protein n=1 Tax=Shinella sp. TaxID=1870904 RepID=UPI0040358B8D